MIFTTSKVDTSISASAASLEKDSKGHSIASRLIREANISDQLFIQIFAAPAHVRPLLCSEVYITDLFSTKASLTNVSFDNTRYCCKVYCGFIVMEAKNSNSGNNSPLSSFDELVTPKSMGSNEAKPLLKTLIVDTRYAQMDVDYGSPASPSNCSHNSQYSAAIAKKLTLRKGKDEISFTACTLFENELWDHMLSKFCLRSDFESRYMRCKVLGSGKFASVSKVQNTSNNKTFACKAYCKRSLLSDSNYMETFLNEAEALQKLNSMGMHNLIDLYELQETPDSVLILEDYLEGGDLAAHLQQRTEMISDTEVTEVMFGLLSALAHLEARNIIHRDIKPQNIMIKHSNSEPWTSEITLVDFGFALCLDDKVPMISRCGTPGYLAPEVQDFPSRRRQAHSFKSDVYGLGCACYLLFTGRIPFDGASKEEVLKLNARGQVSFEGRAFRQISRANMSLLKAMLTLDPSQRPLASECLALPMFNQLKAARERLVELEIKMTTYNKKDIDEAVEVNDISRRICSVKNIKNRAISQLDQTNSNRNISKKNDLHVAAIKASTHKDDNLVQSLNNSPNKLSVPSKPGKAMIFDSDDSTGSAQREPCRDIDMLDETDITDDSPSRQMKSILVPHFTAKHIKEISCKTLITQAPNSTTAST
jgi:calcium/calmodulin-dependent protein kinase I